MIAHIAFLRFFYKLGFWNSHSATKRWLLDHLSSGDDPAKQDLYQKFLQDFGWNQNQFQKKYELIVDQVRRELDLNYKFTWFGEASFPALFYFLEDSPLLLSYLGESCWEGRFCLSVVGSREPTQLSQDWMKSEFLEFLKQVESPLCIVSGGARGLDQMAHQLSLLANKSTVLFLPSGLSCPYPESLSKMRQEMIENGGAIVSEYDANLSMHKGLFSHRNRLIAAMNHSLLIVEASQRSGALMTAHYALELGKPIWVVPGHPLNKAFSGSVDLISFGAQMVRHREDLKIFLSVEQQGLSTGSGACHQTRDVVRLRI